MRTNKLLLVAAAALALSACGGSDDMTTARPTQPAATGQIATEPSVAADAQDAEPASITEQDPPATEPVDDAWPPSDEALDDALLPLSAFPTGWAAVLWDEDGDGPECGETIPGILGLDRSDLPRAEARYAKDEDNGPFASLNVSVLPASADDIDVLSALRESIVGCEWKDDGWTYRVSEMSYPQVGDQSMAIRTMAASDHTSFPFDAVYLRSGSILVVVMVAALYDDTIRWLDEFVPAQMERAIDVLG